MVITKCHVCGGTDFDFLYSVQDANQGVPGKWDILKCHNCGLGVLSPLPTPDVIASFYQETFYSTSSQLRFNSVVETLRMMLGRMRCLGIRKLMRRKGKILDYGSGAGHFVSAMRRLGVDVSSVDIANQDNSLIQGRDVIAMDNERPRMNFPEHYFDAVSLWYVVEHLLSPRETIREIRRILKPGGILLLAQQDFSSLQSRFFKVNWLVLDPPRHIYQFNEKNLTSLCEELGFSLVRLERSSIEMGPFNILQSMLNCLLGNENYLFRLFKNESLRNANGLLQWENKQKMLAWVSVTLSVVLGPLSLLIYYVLQVFRQSDVFIAYYRSDLPNRS